MQIRFFTLIFCLLFAQPIFAQSGYLLIGNDNPNPQPVSLFEYPGPVTSAIDTAPVQDFHYQSGKDVWAAGDSLVAYTPGTWAATTLLPATGINRVENHDSLILTLHNYPPYFRAWSNGQLLFSIDSSKLGFPPNDLIVDNGVAYLMLNRYFARIDLNSQDTLSRINTPHPVFWGPTGPGFNIHVIKEGRSAYFAVDYATGAPRFSLMKLNLDNLQLDTLIYEVIDILGPRMVKADDRMYLGRFPSYYSISDDSFYVSPSLNAIPLAWDSANQVMFVHLPDSQQVRSWSNGMYTNTAAYTPYLFNYRPMLFIQDKVNSVSESSPKPEMQVFPNPSTGRFGIRMDRTLTPGARFSCYDSQGRLVHQFTNPQALSAGEEIECTLRLPAGIYIMKVEGSEGFTSSSKLLIQSE